MEELQRLVAGATASQEALEEWLGELDPVEPGTPSVLPGWTVGHVLTHLARNAESHVRMLAGEPQYPGGADQREGEIAAGAGRPWMELVADVAAEQAALSAAWAAHTDWDMIADRNAGPRPAALLPFYRWREVEIHRVDLGLGYTFADLPAEYLRRELVRMEMLWKARKPMGMTTLPGQVLALPPPTRLAWLMGRAEIEGLSPAGVF